MNNHFKHDYDDYLCNHDFLELVEKYQEYTNIRELRKAIADEVYTWINEVHEHNGAYMNLGEAKALINVMQYIIDQRESQDE